ncbi:MAG: hypothetical protein ABIQ30_07500 [Devosia sp.]
MKKIEKFPESKVTEVARLASDGLIGALPVIGTMAATAITALVSASLEKRRTEWFNRIGEGLSDLEKRLHGFDPSDLANNEEFASAVYEMTDAAMKASTESKRDRLANVVLNIAAGRSLQDALRGRFVSLVQSFSEEHILLLRIADKPTSFPKIAYRLKSLTMGGRQSLYGEELRDRGISEDLISVVITDLQREGLIDNGAFGATMSAQGLASSITTHTGKAFLSFVEAPVVLTR